MQPLTEITFTFKSKAKACECLQAHVSWCTKWLPVYCKELLKADLIPDWQAQTIWVQIGTCSYKLATAVSIRRVVTRNRTVMFEKLGRCTQMYC